MTNRKRADVIIVGGGVAGTAIARELSRYQLSVVLLEGRPDIGTGASKANSGILHAGFDATTGSLKAGLNVRGNKLYRNIAEELDLDLAVVGSLVIAKTAGDLKTVLELLERGKRNGVSGLEFVDREVVLAREPNIAKDIVGALWAPTAGILCPFRATVAFAENAIRNGAQVIRECPVLSVAVSDGRVAGVNTEQGFWQADYVVNAAGVHADDLARSAGDDSIRIKARKGEYILFDREYGGAVHSVLFPTPTAVSKGILAAPTVHGNLFIGPNANDTGKEDLAVDPSGLTEIIEGGRRLLPDLPLAGAITEFAGLRAVEAGGDFVIRQSATVQGLIHAAGVQSPGLTAAPAIAEMVAEVLRDSGLKLVPKASFQPENPRRPNFMEMTAEEQTAAMQRDPRFGRVICRCETVTEGEIVAAIHSPCGARTVDGIKRRTRAGSGRCQGGFCGPRVAAILARELDMPLTKVRKDMAQSYLYYDKDNGGGADHE